MSIAEVIDMRVKKNSVPTSQKTLHIYITKTNQLILYGEMIADYSEKHTTPPPQKRK
jgi:hypothetical protein